MKMLKNLEYFEVSIEFASAKDASLVTVWNRMAEQMTGASASQLVALRQQFFIGAQSYERILKIAVSEHSLELIKKMSADIEKNLLGVG